MWPKKTFFGLDKSKAHCFTLPKKVTEEYIQHFSLGDGNLQSEIFFIIHGCICPAEIRLVRINRSKPYKLRKEDLKKREVVQFQWPKEKLTITAFRNSLQLALDQISSGHKNENYPVTFHHKEGSIFSLTFD
tara:strand:+ start:535 stop:930 length:396 start_codon:yes stop_codon:yes gene_type:complete